ncbi:MAG: cupin domain-containing protein [Bacteroidota bacterium]
MDSKSLIEKLELMPHPEGGYYKETYRSEELINKDDLPLRFNDDRNFSTGIYYLLENEDFSAFHRIKSDEMWHFYAGTTLLIHEITAKGNYIIHRLGNNLNKDDKFQLVIPHGSWFASEVEDKNSFSFVGCTVSPGFDFNDFEMAKSINLSNDHPNLKNIIKRLCAK